MDIKYLHISPFHVLMSFLKTLKPSADFILTEREFKFLVQEMQEFLYQIHNNFVGAQWDYFGCFEHQVSDFLKKFFI